MSECTKEDDEDSGGEIYGFDLRDLLREEGIRYRVYPEDYDSEEEFVTALDETVDGIMATYKDNG